MFRVALSTLAAVKAPAVAPSVATRARGRADRRDRILSRWKLVAPETLWSRMAMRLVPLAIAKSMPRKVSMGKTKKAPPPATMFKKPWANPTATMAPTCHRLNSIPHSFPLPGLSPPSEGGMAHI
ncbi:MAG: hypothetical protein BWY88_00743 [Synergistetes bacterium ADurb.Bin520]|nr:MAG: hypothetical protein BWY88_00743 [Synergistetes bacterium ADurb.Bin520]